MKKLITFLSLLTFLFANNVKDGKWFVNLNGGSLKIHSTDSVIGLKVGYYFYDPNIYKINNRILIDFKKVNSDADFYVTSLKLDWLKNTSTGFVPFLGVNIGYLYFKENSNDYSAGIWGGELGIMYEFSDNFAIEIEGCYQKAYEKTNIWNSPLKTLKGGVEFTF